jgi:hypothetical protein
MKFKNPLLVASIIALSFSSIAVSADDSAETAEKSEKKVHKLKAKIADNRDMELYNSLDEDTKAEVMALKEANTEAFKALKEEYKAMEQTDENRVELKEKMKELKDALYADLQEVLEGNEKALAVLEEKMEKAAEYVDRKVEKMKMRESNRGEKKEKIKKYKKAFAEKLKNNIDNIPQERLESVHSKVLVIIEKVEAREDMDEEKQNALISQLIALQEIIEDQIELNEFEA